MGLQKQLDTTMARGGLYKRGFSTPTTHFTLFRKRVAALQQNYRHHSMAILRFPPLRKQPKPCAFIGRFDTSRHSEFRTRSFVMLAWLVICSLYSNVHPPGSHL